MARDTVIIHVRFFNDGTVAEIGERPVKFTDQAWFDNLAAAFIDCYHTYSGGRGAFRLTPADLAGAQGDALQ